MPGKAMGPTEEEASRAGVELWRVRAGAFKNPSRRRNGSREETGQVADGGVHRLDSCLVREAAAPVKGGGKLQTLVGQR